MTADKDAVVKALLAAIGRDKRDDDLCVVRVDELRRAIAMLTAPAEATGIVQVADENGQYPNASGSVVTYYGPTAMPAANGPGEADDARMAAVRQVMKTVFPGSDKNATYAQVEAEIVRVLDMLSAASTPQPGPRERDAALAALEVAAKECDHWQSLSKTHKCGEQMACVIRGLKRDIDKWLDAALRSGGREEK